MANSSIHHLFHTNTLPQSIEGDSPQDITLVSSSSSSVDGNVFPEDPSAQDVEFDQDADESAATNNVFAALTYGYNNRGRRLSCDVGINTCSRRSHCTWVGGNRNSDGACCELNDWDCRNQFNRRPTRRPTGGGGTVLQNCNDFGIRTWNDCKSDCRARHNNWSASYKGRDESNLTRCVCDYGTNRRNNFTCERRANSPTRRHYSYLSEDNKMDPYGEDFDSSTSEDVEMESYDEDFYAVY